jgi:hypothetical protein
LIYVYAIGERGSAWHAGPGLEGRSVECVRHGALGAFVSDGVDRAPVPTVALLRVHDRIVAALAARGTVLPMRFGTTIGSEGELRGLLEDRSEEFERSLARVRGRVEFGARAVWDAPESPPAGSDGRAFMQAKLDRRLAARRSAERLHAPLAELAAESVCRLVPAPDTAFTAAYLVERTRVGELERQAGRLDDTSERLHLTVSGPWPPYSFAEAPE